MAFLTRRMSRARGLALSASIPVNVSYFCGEPLEVQGTFEGRGKGR